MLRTARKTLLIGLLTGGLVGLVTGGAIAAAGRYDGDGASWDQHSATQRIVVLGDSLVGQSRPMLKSFAATRADEITIAFVNGGAPCDLLPDYAKRIVAARATRIELAFVGNATTPCMTKAIGHRTGAQLSTADREKVARIYNRDIATMIHWNKAHHIITWLALPPAMRPGTYHAQLNEALVSLYKGMAQRDPANVRSNGMSRDLLTPGGRFRVTETLDGKRVYLRKSDGTHLIAPAGTYENALGLLLPLVLDDRHLTRA